MKESPFQFSKPCIAFFLFDMLSRFIGLFLLLLPLQFALNPSPSIDLSIARIGATLIFFWWLAETLGKRKMSLPSPLLVGSVVSFIFLAGISFLWAEDIDFWFRKFLFLLNFFPLIFVFFDLGREEKTRVFFVHMLLVGAGLVSIIAIGIFLSQFVLGEERVFSWLTTTLPFFLGQNLGAAVAEYPSLLVNIRGETILRATAFFPDPHVASFYFGMSGFLSLGLLFSTKKKFWFFLVALLLLTDLLTFSRGGYLGLLSGGLVFLLLSWKGFSLPTKKYIAGSLLALLIILVLWGEPVLSRLVSSFSLADTSSTERLVLWQRAIENIESSPFLGTGLGNYSLAVNPLADYRLPYYAHNLYLDIATELGLFGLFLFLLIIALAYSNILKNVRMSQATFFPASLLAALTLYLTHSLFETALYSVHILPLLVFVLAISFTQKEKARLPTLSRSNAGRANAVASA